MAAEWRRDLTFADRLEATTKMQVSLSFQIASSTQGSRNTDVYSRTAAYRTSHPACEAAEASKHAKAAEETARKTAVSQAEYHDLVAKAVQDLHEGGEAVAPAGDAPPGPDVEMPTSGAVMGRYINAQHHRDGLFSEVFKAALPASERRPGRSNVVALKVTSPDMEGPPHDSRREARLLQAAKHGRVISLIETFQQPGGRFALVFSFLPYDLDALLRQHLLTDRSRRSIVRDIFSALAHLHSLNIIHRDIKPSNILLASPTGPAYLSDFGIAWSPSESAGEPADEKILDVGTTCYRPPELLFGNRRYGTKLDMWASGCTAAQIVCLNDQTLFEAGDVGSELALIKSVFETLGTPGLDVWPEASTFPDWGKMNFKQYSGKPWPEILPHANADAIDLVSNLVVFESRRRLSAEAALQHPYLHQ